MWDWRSLQCEPACYCSFEFLWGDYHLGRSCRKRRHELAVCEPTVYIQDKQVPKRILSLIRQTTDILKDKVHHTVGNVVNQTTERYGKVQEIVCFDLWSRLEGNPTTGGSCWSALPVAMTIPEKIFCGRIDVPACTDDGQYRAENKAAFGATAAAAAELARRKERIFADLYEKEF